MESIEEIRTGSTLGRRHRWPVWGERGQSIIEMAIIMPLILFIMAGVFDFGRVIHAYVVVVNATREASFAGAAEQLSDSSLQTLIDEELARGGVSNGTPTTTITYADSGSPAVQTLTVTLAYEVPLVILSLPFTSVTVRSVAQSVTFW